MDIAPLLLVLLLIALLATIGLGLLLLTRLRHADPGNLAARLEDALRTEQRDGRIELRGLIDAQAALLEQRTDGFGLRFRVGLAVNAVLGAPERGLACGGSLRVCPGRHGF